MSQTSVPRWAWDDEAPLEAPDPRGRTFTLLVLPGARVVADAWAEALAGRAVRRHDCPDADAAVAALRADLATARVGHRVLVAGSARECLAVRGAGVRAGLADDEMTFGVLDTAERAVWCVHCDTTNLAAAAIDDVVACTGCGRRLLVYPHVSRRTGAHLGFMVDAETAA
ncbi:dimethylamine monooxygenase subunit DmmA family protein [Nocardioides zeae]|uniref:Dimethylamine monooxygenase subunit DmmA family protein n=1 Tax=Nocardioides imazamoxiresistens TaxID=3231893 RepID=A0ABU3PYQ4_9ACTN|nr:dimethylamine monooxygenase subunit DmmA family protein [Nocardioides zeae]MDT9594006.1 dimethylamine monooxygenase subunit DmmA family protein [Nocardioides zeae]